MGAPIGVRSRQEILCHSELFLSLLPLCVTALYTPHDVALHTFLSHLAGEGTLVIPFVFLSSGSAAAKPKSRSCA